MPFRRISNKYQHLYLFVHHRVWDARDARDAQEAGACSTALPARVSPTLEPAHLAIEYSAVTAQCPSRHRQTTMQ